MEAPGDPQKRTGGGAIARSILVPILVLVSLVAASCSTTSPDTEIGLAIDAERVNEGRIYAMAADALDRGAVDEPTTGDRLAVIVPSDDALLALDADALASLVADDGIPDLLRRSVVRAGWEPPVRAGLVLLLGDGTSVRIGETDGELHLDDVALTEVVAHGPFDLLVVDGLVVEP